MVHLEKSWFAKENKYSQTNIGLKKGDEICFEHDNVAEQFNNFVCNIATDLLKKYPIALIFLILRVVKPSINLKVWQKVQTVSE